MKKFKFLVMALALVIGISSCKKEERNNNNTSIVGKWFLKKRVSNNYRDGVSTGENINTNFTSQDYVEFKSDGKGISGDNGQFYPFTYTLTNEGKTLTFIEDGDTDSYAIKTLSNTELVLFMESTYNQDGIINKYTEEITLSR